MTPSTGADGESQVRLRQQEVVADLGQQALEIDDIDRLMHDACVAVADTLDNEYCKVLELLPGGDEVFLRQGVGWRDGLVGEATVPTDLDSQAGYTLLSEESVIVDDLRTEDRFSGPELLTSHDVVSGISVIIGSVEDPWGILGTHSSERHDFTADDAAFVQNVANILASAIETKRRERELERALDLLHKTERIADVGGWEIDTETTEVFWTEHVFELLEVPTDEEPSLDAALDMYHEDDRHLVQDAIDEALAAGAPFDVEARIRTHSGDVRWLRLQGFRKPSTTKSSRSAGQPRTSPSAKSANANSSGTRSNSRPYSRSSRSASSSRSPTGRSSRPTTTHARSGAGTCSTPTPSRSTNGTRYGGQTRAIGCRPSR